MSVETRLKHEVAAETESVDVQTRFHHHIDISLKEFLVLIFIVCIHRLRSVCLLFSQIKLSSLALKESLRQQLMMSQ